MRLVIFIFIAIYHELADDDQTLSVVTHRYIQCERLMHHCESLEILKLIQIRYFLLHFNDPLLYPGKSFSELLCLVVQRTDLG